jgi:hypothetical protein
VPVLVDRMLVDSRKSFRLAYQLDIGAMDGCLLTARAAKVREHSSCSLVRSLGANPQVVDNESGIPSLKGSSPWKAPPANGNAPLRYKDIALRAHHHVWAFFSLGG